MNRRSTYQPHSRGSRVQLSEVLRYAALTIAGSGILAASYALGLLTRAALGF